MDVAEHAGLGELERRREGERQQTQDLKRRRGLGSEAEGKEAGRARGSWPAGRALSLPAASLQEGDCLALREAGTFWKCAVGAHSNVWRRTQSRISGV